MKKTKKIKEIFKGSEEMIKTALDLEIDYSVEFLREIHVKNKLYVFSVKLTPKKQKE